MSGPDTQTAITSEERGTSNVITDSSRSLHFNTTVDDIVDSVMNQNNILFAQNTTPEVEQQSPDTQTPALTRRQLRDQQRMIDRARVLIQRNELSIEMLNAIRRYLGITVITGSNANISQMMDRDFVHYFLLFRQDANNNRELQGGVFGIPTLRRLGLTMSEDARDDEMLTNLTVTERASVRLTGERLFLKNRNRIKNQLAAIVLSEAWPNPEQEHSIAWIYYNIVCSQGEDGLDRSAAHAIPSGSYQRWFAMVSGQPQSEVLRLYRVIGENYTASQSERASRVKTIVDNIFLHRENNPFPNMDRQGNLSDLNTTVPFEKAKAVFWEQFRGSAPPLVFVLGVPPGQRADRSQFMFNALAVRRYFTHNGLSTTNSNLDADFMAELLASGRFRRPYSL